MIKINGVYCDIGEAVEPIVNSQEDGLRYGYVPGSQLNKTQEQTNKKPGRKAKKRRK